MDSRRRRRRHPCIHHQIEEEEEEWEKEIRLNLSPQTGAFPSPFYTHPADDVRFFKMQKGGEETEYTCSNRGEGGVC